MNNSHGHNHGDSNTSRIPRLVPVDRTAKAKTNSAPSNIAAATVIIESDDAHYCLSPHRSGGAAGLTTLQDLLRFNPGNLDTSLKKGFLVYQLLKAVEGLHEHGLVHGSIKPSNIYIDENLWITLTGIKCSIQDESTVMKWVKGEISNFTYLMILNHAAGRRYGDPNVHPIFPWVTDFTGAEVQQGWRDFTKTKFRLNKGDEQLDVTYDGPIPHHITAILSDITYYVYMARRIPIPVLCQFVRSKYEANEYPSSIRRLYEWTPDECIPEFYTDPNIFRSIHADMPDMALPAWASTPEDFIRIHREALESDHVSRHLHKWIDLTFGHRLSGPGAVEAKNVALSLFPGQSEFMKHGIIQLFTDPHPQRLSNWSLSKEDFLKSQTEKQTELEKASKAIKRRSVYLPTSERPQFVDKVSDLLFRPTGPTRSKSLRQPPGSRPISIVTNPNIFEREPTGPSLYDTSLALASTRPEALVQFIQSETIEFSKDLKEATFTEELEHFEATYRFGSKYHFMNSSAARARILADAPGLTSDGPTTRKEDSFEYMQSWDIPVAVSGTITAMLNKDWNSRPLMDDILQKSVPALSLQSPTISMFVPTLMAEIYEFLAMFYVCPESTQMELANKWIDRICAFEDETFDIALPVLVTKPILPAELLATSAFTEFLRRFGSGTFLQQLFPYYLESLTADYGPGEIISDDNSSSSRSIGPILTSKHVMRPFSRLAYKDPISLPLLKETLGGIAQEFGSTFALVQFSHIIHLIESSAKTFNARTSNTMRNLLGMLGSLVPHMYDTQLVTELKNGGSDLIYRLIEPSPRKPTNRQDSQANPRLAVSRHAMDFILQLSSSLTRTDWEKHVSILHGSHRCKIWQKGHQG
ncbi:MAG: hypothetical protein J3Q66DRAFT_275023 [Benniella sp.]|nr:MAG: hypothetical protein J3Q66DRAFT_275023 [Benniella sp.]